MTSNIQSSNQCNPFGVLFAYDSDLDWDSMVKEIKENHNCYSANQIPNIIHILSKGSFLFGDDTKAKFFNSEMEMIKDAVTYGFPDIDGSGFYAFYKTIYDLLRATITTPPQPSDYFSLPLTSGKLTYEYVYGAIEEVGHCQEHGSWQRKISATNLKKISEYCDKETPINWVRAMDIAHGKPGDDQKAYDKQPGDVRIYNPEKLPLSDVLLNISEIIKDNKKIKTKSLAFYTIKIDKYIVLIPWYYSEKNNLIQKCPKCSD